ncbi:1907_t:CDS:10 [Paraglomus brasilianum]|uniref:1907_t:CDS:1 n=1 Tax=Paraglomus brasilianum TaxID=144538 RepID=A0A9N8ZM93_9GLOM|nr:1907_t:CDS:10 [Paraglomus brasilianum]
MNTCYIVLSESIQFAPLAGRILFKNLKYLSRNQSIIVLKGSVTWRYWLWSVREDRSNVKNDDGGDNDKDLPCRVICNLNGVEWFVYNRKPAYDALSKFLDENSNTVSDQRDDITVDLDEDIPDDSQISFFRRLLPIQIDCERGAIIVGNPYVQPVLVTEFAQASGIYAALKTRSQYDHYKAALRVTFRNPRIHLRPNEDYKGSPLTQASRRTTESANEQPEPSGRFSSYFDRLSACMPFFQNTSSMNTAEWYGLPRYLNDDLPGVSGDGIADEYAKVTTILECVSLDLNYYVDVAGKVPPSLSLLDESNGIDVGNGDLAPEWTVELEVEGGVINYGPWADRQRVQLQNFFFPPLYRNSEKTKMLSPGDDRLHTALKISIIFKTETVIRIPTREASKDWNFEESALDEPSTPAARSYGWMDLRVGLESSVNVIVPMVTDDNGYSVQLDIRLDKPELQTSINFANLLTAERCTITCGLQNPLVWNAPRQWEFRIEFCKADTFLLRDHIILFQDLVKDWTSGPLVQLRYFIPINYDIRLYFKQGFQLFLYVNERNIIENPNPMDADDNTFVIKGKELHAKIDLPFVQYKPEVTKILFDAMIVEGNIMMSPQASHSLGSFLSEDGKKFGQVDNFTINGTYQYYSFVDPSHVESVSLNMKGKKVNLKLFGFVVRYFIIILENYAGDYINFVTLEEYARERSSPVSDRRMPSKPPADLFEVYLVLVIEDGSLSLPENLYTAENCSTIQFHELQLELRNLDLYMDMDITVSPLTIVLDQEDVARKHSRLRLQNNYLFLDDLNIYAHRLYGPRPKTAAYVCNWDINLGTISGQLRPPFLLSLSSFARAFAYHLVDEESALPIEFANPDVTFLNVKVKDVDVSIRCRDSCSQILLSEGICVQYDNLANEKYLQRVVLKIPELFIKSLAMVATPGSPVDVGFDVEDYPWVEVANFETAFDVTLFRTESGWRQRFNSQQAFIKEQDNETLRAPFLYEKYKGHLRSTKTNNDTIYAPPMPPPILDDMDSGPPRYRSNDLSSDILADHKNVFRFGTRYGLFDETDDLVENIDSEGLKTDNDSVTGSAVSISNTSFVTASDGDTTDEELDSSNSEFSYDTFHGRRYETETYVDTINYESNYPRRARFSHQIENVVSQSEPMSIPYGRYLRRYKHKSQAPQFTSSFLRPSRLSFEPARKHENPSIGETDSPSYTSSTFSKMMNEEAIEPSIEEDSETSMTIIFEATKPIKVLLTPIFLRIIQEILEAISNENWNMEAMLDAMQIDYISKLNSITLFEYDTARLVASIPKIHLHFIQDVLLPDDLTKVIDENSSIRTRYDLTDTMLCTADLVLERTLFTGLLKFKDVKFDKNAGKNTEPDWHLDELRTNLELDALKLNVRFVTATKSVGVFGIPEKMHGFTDAAFEVDVLDDDPVVLHVSLKQLKIKLSRLMQPNEFAFNMENLIAISVAQSAEIFTGAVYSWLIFIDDIAKILSDFLKRRKRQLQVLVSQIASFSNKARIESDPSHLTRPSHLLRLKVKTFKNDDGWKILGRLRHCKREMEKSTETMNKVKTLLTCKELHVNDSNAMYVTAVKAFSTWRHWEIGDLSKSHFFTKVFDRPHPTDLPARTVNIPHFIASSTNIGKLYIGLISLSVLEENRENSVKVGPLAIDAESSYRSGLPIVETMQEPPLSPFRFGNVDSGKNIMTALEGYLYVVLKVQLNQVAVDVNPDMLAFAKHWLRVQRVFATRRDTMSAEIKFSRTDVIAGGSKNVGHKSTSTITSLQEIKTVKYKEKISNIDKRKATKLNLWARLEVVAHALVFVETVALSASAQQLLGRAQFSSINISALLHSPQAMQLIERLEIENSSIGHSSVKAGSRGSGRSSHKLKFTAAGGMRKAVMTIKELNPSSQKQVTLLSVKVSKVCGNVTLSKLTSPRNRTKGDAERKLLNTFVGIKKVSVELPESLLKLFRFVEQWQEENLPQYDFLFKRLMNEWEVQRKKSSKDVMSIDSLEKATEKFPLEIKFQFLLERLSFVSNLLPSLQLRYHAYNFMAMSQKGSTTKGNIITHCLGQLKKQEIHFVTRQSQKGKKPTLETTSDSRDEYKQETAFSIPAIRATGSMRPHANKKVTSLKKGNTLVQQKYSQLESSLTLDSVKLGLNVNIIDHLLTTQSLLSSELNDALELFIFSSKKYKERSASHRSSSSSFVPEPTTGNCENKLIYTVRIALRGLRIAAASPTAVVFFETNVLNGLITNDPMISGAKKTDQPGWKFSAQKFTLSLNPNTSFMNQASADEDIRKYRIAYILIDLALQNFRDKRATDVSESVMPEEIDVLESYFLKLLKVHAVMQPLALGRLMDLYVYYSSELDRRKELKASDINELANNTRKIINSFNVDLPKYKKTSKLLLDEKIFSLEIIQFAVALPLDLREEMILTSQNNGEISIPQTPALLFSSSSMNFIARQWKSACASIKKLSLQFVNQFDSGIEDPFSSAIKDEKMNRVNYPEIYCKVHATGTKSNKFISVDSRVEGFDIHISGDIVNYINTLNEIYATSRERFETFAAEANIGSQLHLQSKSKSTLTNPVEESSIAVNLEVQIAFAAKSGVMRLYPKNFLEHQQAKRSSRGSGKRPSIRSASTNSGIHLQHSVSSYDIYSLDDTSKLEESGIDSITIPGLSLNTTYRTVLGEMVSSSAQQIAKRAHVELIVHPSENIFLPSLVPFIKDIINGLKIGVQRSSDKKATAVEKSESSIYGIDFTFYFMLSRTKFELSCRPTSVSCIVIWEEGNFLVSSNSSNSGQSLTLVGKIRGASAKVRHKLSPDDDNSASAETKDISFNATLMSRRTDTVSDDSISIIVDMPHITAGLNIRLLQELLVLKAIWLDQATKLYEESMQGDMSRDVSRNYSRVASNVNTEAKAKPYSVYIMLRLQELDLSSDLGQAIGQVRFKTKNIRVKTKRVPNAIRSAMVSTDLLDIVADGRLKGFASMTGLNLFTFLQRPPTSQTDVRTSVSKFLFKTEQIKSSLEYEYQKILVAEIDPMELTVNDQWGGVNEGRISTLVHTQVVTTRVQALASIKTIPVFINMGDKLMALIEGKRSSVANMTNKLVSPPSLGTTEHVETGSNTNGSASELQQVLKDLIVDGIPISLIGKITLNIGLIHITVFPNHFSDVDCVQAKSDGLVLNLKRNTENSTTLHRDLDMQLNNLSLTKGLCKKFVHKDGPTRTIQAWFDHVAVQSAKNIFSLPRTHLLMETWTPMASDNNIVNHKFVTDFGGKVDIALNFGLILYLQELGVLYKEQLRRLALGTSDQLKLPTFTDKSKLQIDTGDVTTAESGSKAAKSSTAEPEKTNKEKKTIQYKPVEQVKLEPQLRIMGDATPPLEWAGLQRAKVPGFVHTSVTLNLDEVLSLVDNVYRQELQGFLSN